MELNEANVVSCHRDLLHLTQLEPNMALSSSDRRLFKYMRKLGEKFLWPRRGQDGTFGQCMELMVVDIGNMYSLAKILWKPDPVWIEYSEYSYTHSTPISRYTNRISLSRLSDLRSQTASFIVVVVAVIVNTGFSQLREVVMRHRNWSQHVLANWKVVYHRLALDRWNRDLKALK